MVSKLSKYVPGLLHKRPRNPYEVAKLTSMDPIQDWYPMTAASIYTTMRNIEKAGYVAGESIQPGIYPAKTVYSLQAVEEELAADIRADLSAYGAEASGFGIAMFHIGCLGKEEARSCAKERLSRLQDLMTSADKKPDCYTGRIPFNMRLMLVYRLNRLQMEIKTTEELIAEIQNTEQWNCSFTQYLGS